MCNKRKDFYLEWRDEVVRGDTRVVLVEADDRQEQPLAAIMVGYQ